MPRRRPYHLFEKLKHQSLHCLRALAFFRPNAHIAFLYYAPYKTMYDNQGQDEELAEFWGEWCKFHVHKMNHPSYYYISFSIRHNNNMYHPRIPNIVRCTRIEANTIIIDYLLYAYQTMEFVFFSEVGAGPARTLLLPVPSKEAQVCDKYYHTKTTWTHYRRVCLWDYLLTHNKTPPRHFCAEEK